MVKQRNRKRGPTKMSVCATLHVSIPVQNGLSAVMLSSHKDCDAPKQTATVTATGSARARSTMSIATVFFLSCSQCGAHRFGPERSKLACEAKGPNSVKRLDLSCHAVVAKREGGRRLRRHVRRSPACGRRREDQAAERSERRNPPGPKQRVDRPASAAEASAAC